MRYRGLFKRIQPLLRIIISLILFFFLFKRLERATLWDTLISIPIYFWALSFFIYLISQIISTIRWWIILKEMRLSGEWLEFAIIYFKGIFFNLFLPTSIGGDLYKIHTISKKNHRFQAVLSVFQDRLMGLISLCLIGMISANLMLSNIPESLWIILNILALLSLLMIIFLKIYKKIFHILGLKDRNPRLITVNNTNPFLKILSLSFLIQFGSILSVVIIGKGLSLNIPIGYYFIALPLITLLTLLPITFNGIGIREYAFIYLFGLRRISAEDAMAMSLLFFSVQILTGIIGGILYILNPGD